MNYIKILLKNFLLIIISISLLSIIYYYGFLDKNTFNILKIIILIIIFIINGFKIEKISKNKFKYNIIISISLFIFLIIFNLLFSKISFKLIIYILIIVTSNLLGGFSCRKKKRN